MAVAAVGQTPFAIYARESAQAESAAIPVRARVVTTEAGLTLGKFGISYTSRDVEFLPGDAVSPANPDASASSSGSSRSSGPGSFSRAESFAAVLEAATLSRSLTGFGCACGSSDGTTPLASRPYATAAYAAAATASLTPPPQRTLLATV